MPAVIFKVSFVHNWHIKGESGGNNKGDFLDYMTRPDAFESENHTDETDEYYDFLEYMRNDDKSDGAFDEKNNLLTESQLDEYREMEMQSKAEGCPKYIGVMSFDNNFLRNNGILIGEKLNTDKVKEVARLGINALISNSKKLDNENVYWTAAIHTNTDNVHVHYSICEKQHRKQQKNSEDKKDNDCIELSAIKALKSAVANNIIGKTRSEEITKIKRQIIFPELSNAMGSAENLLTDLANKLPDNISLQYGNHRMKPFQREIDRCVDKIIGSNVKLKESFDMYRSSIESMDSQYREFYGEKSNASMYSEHQLDDFYNRAGNILLKHIKSMRNRSANNDDEEKERKEELEKKLSAYSVSERKEKDGMKLSADIVKILRDNNRYISNYRISDKLKNALEQLPEKNLEYNLGFLKSVADTNDTAAFAVGLHYLNSDSTSAEKYLQISADNNNSDAQYQLAKLYLKENKKTSAEPLLRLSADNGNSYAQLSYGVLLYNSGHKENSFHYLTKADEGGNKIAHNMIMTLKKREEQTPHSPTPVRKNNYISNIQNDDDSDTEISLQSDDYEPERYTVDVSDNHSQSKYYLRWSNSYKDACKLIYDKESELSDFQKAEQILLAESKSGNVLAIHDLGKLYSTDKLGEKNEKKSFEFYKEALQAFTETEQQKDLKKFQPYIQYRIGKMHCYGLGTEKDDKKAFDWFLKSAQQDNKFAQYSVANLYYFGNGVEKDLSQAFSWYKQSASKGQPYASYAVAQMYKNGESVSKDENMAQQYYKQALSGFLKMEKDNQADDNLFYKIGTMYKNGLGTDIDIPKATEYFKRSADMENKNALYEYGKMLLLGEQVSQDTEKAVKLIEKAITLENSNAKRFLALEYISGEHVEQNTKKGLAMLTESADNGDVFASYKLGSLYASGKYIPKNFDLAEKYLSVAAKKNNVYAQYQLGKMYLDPDNLHFKRAEKQLTSAAEQGYTPAQLLLGKTYLKEEKYNLAEKWLTVSAKSGDTFAQYNLGKLYLSPKYRDLGKAVTWLKSSADGGNQFGQLAYGVLEYKIGNHKVGMEYMKKSAESGNEFAEKVIENVSRVRGSKPSNVRHAVKSSFLSSQNCWYTLKRIMQEYQSHIRSLQAEFDYENNVSCGYDFDYGYSY